MKTTIMNSCEIPDFSTNIPFHAPHLLHPVQMNSNVLREELSEKEGKINGEKFAVHSEAKLKIKSPFKGSKNHTKSPYI